MKIPFEKLIADYNRKHPEKELNERKLATIMYEVGLYRSVQVAQNAIQRHKKGKAEAIKFDLFVWLVNFFQVKGTDIIKFKEPTISEVSTHIRDDAPGLKNLKQ